MLKKTSLVTAMALYVLTTSGCTVYSQGSLASGKFSDTKGHWAEAAINAAATSGYVNGYEDGTFRPDANISRAEFIKLVATVTGTKAVETSGGEWYKPYVDALAKRGVVRAGEFSDYNEKMTRMELTKIALREVREDVRNPQAIMGDSSYMYSAVKSGLIQGLAGGELGVEEKTTRAQALTIIERIKSLKAGKELEVDKRALSKAEIALNGSNVNATLGLQPKEIGTTWSLGQGASAQLEQVIISDPNDPNDPFLHLLDLTYWPKMAVKEESVIVLTKFKVTVKESADKNVILYANQHFMLSDGTGTILLNKDYGLPRAIQFSKPGEYIGYVSYSSKKEKASRGLVFTILNNRALVAKK